MDIQVTPHVFFFEGKKGYITPGIGIVSGLSSSLLVDVSNDENLLKSALDYIVSTPLAPLKSILLTHFHDDHIENLPKLDKGLVVYASKNTGRYINGRPFVEIDEDTKIDLGGVQALLVTIPSLHAKGCLGVLAEGVLFLGDAIYSREKDGVEYYDRSIAYNMREKIGSLPFKTAIIAHEDMAFPKEAIMSFLDNLVENGWKK